MRSRRTSSPPWRPRTPSSSTCSARRGARVSIKVPLRGDRRALLDTAVRNAEMALSQAKLRRASDLTTRNMALDEIADALGLSEPPLRIECYDISHTMGEEVVGSMVVFEDGLPRTSQYRRFIIKSFEGSNDVAAISEVLQRRLRRLVDDRASEVKVDATTGEAAQVLLSSGAHRGRRRPPAGQRGRGRAGRGGARR